MAKIYTKGTTVVDEVLSGAARYDILEDGGGAFKSDMQINLATSVAVAGTEIDAARLNNMENGIDGLDTKLADALDLLTTGGTSTAYTITTIGAAALATGEAFRVKFHATAGATPTLNRDTLGAKSLKYYDAVGAKQAVTSSQIIANMILTIIYDGTDYVILGGSGGVSDSWSIITDTLTYATANSFTVPTDLTSFYRRGLKLKLTQSTDKYFQVVSSSYSAPNTTVIISAGDNYSLANAVITNPKYSNEETPNDFPATFSWTPIFTGFSVNPTTVDCKFKLLPYGMYSEILATGGTSNANAFTITAPPGITLPVSSTLGLVFITIDNGAVITTSPGKLVSNASNRYTIQKDFAGAAWTASGTKGARFIGIHLLP